ncbi:protein tyrosine phosphatase family protein [Thalassotalea crassostreae]|uniref:protein tyrosine phosphatase family protein n=1 Tax=Thalassotalea crassostreae TaxID=1763536 RepID=UPI001D03D675|nr:protein tyrosine phosphatase family protein [Thalassotalea crassostreae]
MLLFSFNVSAKQELIDPELSDLKNFQINTDTMVSSGLPNKKHFQALQNMGVTNVIDLIPGDRTEESMLLKELKLNYHNIAVDWDNPTLENFKKYVALMAKANDNEEMTLTHCKLNWRGATFTYLYRVTQLNESEQLAAKDMLAIWQPNETWQAFIEDVKNEYK